jgi:hypothetical protein
MMMFQSKDSRLGGGISVLEYDAQGNMVQANQDRTTNCSSVTKVGGTSSSVFGILFSCSALMSYKKRESKNESVSKTITLPRIDKI